MRKGSSLSEADKKRLSQFNLRLATLFTDFSQNVLEDEKNYVTWIEKKEDLAGLPDSIASAMASAAKERGKPGQWAVTNTRSSMDPFLTYSANRPLREKVWKTYYSRGDNGDSHDNNGIISEILSLRAARAKLLGYKTHAHWRLEPQMAKTPEAALDLMLKVWPKAVQRVKEEVADMQALADKLEPGTKIEPWDYRYYAEKVAKPIRFGPERSEALSAARKAARRHDVGSYEVVRLRIQTDQRRTGIPSRCPRLGSQRQRWQTGRPVVLRSLCPRRQTIGRLDERLSQSRECYRAYRDDRLEQFELHQRQSRRACTHFVGRCGDAVP